jgi:hypothetical protein
VRPLLLAIALSGAAALAQEPGPPPAAEPLDRILVVVGERIVTVTDLRREVWMAGLDAAEPGLLGLARPDPLERAVDAAILRGMAGDVRVYQPTPEAVAARLERLRSAVPDPAEWAVQLRSVGLDEDRLAGWVYSRLVVERYLGRAMGAVETADAAAVVARARTILDEQRTRVVIRVVERPAWD